VGHELRSSTEHENGQFLPRFVGCGEFANRIEGMRVTTDAVPVGHRTLHRIFKGVTMSQGKVISIHIAAVAAAPMKTVAQVKAVAGQGLDGDRYANKLGTYSNDPGSGREVTLIESEAIEALKREYGVELEPQLSRRNIVTRGLALNHFVGKQFNIGAVILRGTRLCEPCAHLEMLSSKGAMRGLIHRGGLRAEIIAGGTIRVGDQVIVAQC
jgi:MOSC domain-containing protein YiiM